MSDETKIKGMGAIPHVGGVGFRVWVPHAERVSVIGSFNGWDSGKHSMQSEDNGYWYADVAEAHVGDQYKFLLSTENGDYKRIDPYAREVTSSVGNAIVHDKSFDWEGDNFHLAPWNELVIYELHVGTFNDDEENDKTGQFASVSARLGHLKKLGVNAIQIMPVAQFAGHGVTTPPIFFPLSLPMEALWHLNGLSSAPTSKASRWSLTLSITTWVRAISISGSSTAGPRTIAAGYISTMMTGPSRRGGKPDLITDVAKYGNIFSITSSCGSRNTMWTVSVSTAPSSFAPSMAPATQDLPEGWSLLQWINSQILGNIPAASPLPKICRTMNWLTKDVGAGGAGFGSQWDAMFVHPIRQAVVTSRR